MNKQVDGWIDENVLVGGNYGLTSGLKDGQISRYREFYG